MIPHKYCPVCRKKFTAADLASPPMFFRQKMCSRACSEENKKHTPEKAQAAFWLRMKKADNGCLEYTGALESLGYGHVNYMGKDWPAHRLAWTLLRGHPGDLHVCHTCDNRKCCNIDHLFLGTDADNMLDKRLKGRDPVRKLTPDQVREIRGQLGKVRQNVLAARYGVSNGIISKLKLGKTYQEVV